MNKTACTVCLFFTSIIWGVAFVAQRVGAEYMGAFTFNGVRFLLGGVSLLPVMLLFERKQAAGGAKKLSALAGVGGGGILFAASSLQQYGVGLTGSAGRSGFLTGLYIVLVPIAGVFMGRKARALTWVGAASAVIGLYLLSAPSSGSVDIGDVMLVMGAFFWTGHIIFIDRFAERILPIHFSMVQFFVCSSLSLICAFLFEGWDLSAVSAGVAPILYGGLLSVGVAYTLQSVGQKGVEPAKAAIIFSLEALFSAVGGAFLLKETMTARGYMGCAFIFVGIIASQMKFSGKQHKYFIKNHLIRIKKI